MKHRRLIVAALSAIAAVGIVAAALTSPTLPVAAQAIPSQPLPNMVQTKVLYSEKCSACHNLPDPVEKGYTRQEWQRTVNRMLTQYKASDSIAPAEATQIVGYLATFAPKTPRPGGHSLNPWETDSADVWTEVPAITRVFNFEAADTLGGLSGMASGIPGPVPAWHVAPDRSGIDGNVAHVTALGFTPDRFALLVDRNDQAQNLDIRVRFRIDSGKASPAVGIIFGFTGTKNYTVLRFNQSLGDLALIQIAGAVHTTLQQTPLVLPVVSAALLPDPAPITPITLGSWHTLRLLVRDGQVRGWVDMNKRISVALPNYTGGKVGLWSQGDTAASFDDWTVDLYNSAPAVPLS